MFVWWKWCWKSKGFLRLFRIIKKRRVLRLLVLSEVVVGIVSKLVVFKVFVFFFCWQVILCFIFCYHACSLFFVILVLLIDAKLPLYAFKKINKVGGKDLVVEKCQEELPLAFLDSLVLGEVIVEFWLWRINDSKVLNFCFNGLLPLYFSGKIAFKKDFFVMMLPPVKPRFDTLILSLFLWFCQFCVYCIVLFGDAWKYFESLFSVLCFLEMHHYTFILCCAFWRCMNILWFFVLCVVLFGDEKIWYMSLVLMCFCGEFGIGDSGWVWFHCSAQRGSSPQEETNRVQSR